jgi:hypothetical protein
MNLLIFRRRPGRVIRESFKRLRHEEFIKFRILEKVGRARDRLTTMQSGAPADLPVVREDLLERMET